MQNLSKDLRPISLTPVLAKMLEHYLIHHMRNICQIVDPNQFGAVKGSYVRVLLIDFSKSFDHIDHQILVQQLDKNGVHPIVQ